MQKSLKNSSHRCASLKRFLLIPSMAFAALSLTACDLTGPSLAIDSEDYCTKLMASSQNSSIKKYQQCIQDEKHFKKLVNDIYQPEEDFSKWRTVRRYVFELKSPSYRDAYRFVTRDGDDDTAPGL